MQFQRAIPVWASGREREMNLTLRFTLAAPAEAGRVLRITGATVYRVLVGETVIAHGPSRGPHGWFRVDEWKLPARAKELTIEVVGYNANGYAYLDRPSFLQAEVLAPDGRILAATGPDTPSEEIRARVQKVPRYSFQRPMMEVYRLDRRPRSVILAAQPKVELLPAPAPLPTLRRFPVDRVIATGTVTIGDLPEPVWRDRALTAIGPTLKGFPESDLEENPAVEIQRHRSQLDPSPTIEGGRLEDGRFAIYDLGRIRSGFPILDLVAEAPTTLTVTFDELLTEGDVNFRRLECVNAIVLHLPAGRTRLEAFEPTAYRYLKLANHGAPLRVREVAWRDLECPDAESAAFRSQDPQLNAIFEAARQTFKQNAVDIFMDCPHRERAGWLCDSFYTARVADSLCGHSRIERGFLESYLLPERFEGLPAGMLPMCYPADHPDGTFIPNWALWLVMQLPEYLARTGDAALIERFRPPVDALLGWFKGYENEFGLLEKLPGWVFVEWSAANSFVQDVNYPTNMLYAAALEVAGRLYGSPEHLEQANKLRRTIHEQSFDGRYYVDNALRREGRLEVTQNRSETCQYYAFTYGIAHPQTHPALWRELLTECGPDRTHPVLHKANAIVGNYLRLELLSQEGQRAKLVEEIRGYFSKMANLTGTLWEHDGPYASCVHGFASHVAHVLLRDVLGVSVDRVRKEVRVLPPQPGLPDAEGQLPAEGGRVRVIRRAGTKPQVRVPRGWKVVREP